MVLPSLVADQEGSPVNIEEAPSLEETVAKRPLTSEVVPETRGAHDAVPDEAQKFMSSFRPFAGDKRDPGPGQLPGNQAFAGTQEDATGVSQSLPTVAHHPDATIDPLTEDGTELKGDAAAEDAGSDESSEDEGDFGGESEDGFDDEGGEDDGELWGEPRTELVPLFELAGDGLHDLKEAAKAGQSAATALQQVPVHLLEVEHRDQINRLRSIIGELLTLTGSLFQRKG